MNNPLGNRLAIPEVGTRRVADDNRAEVVGGCGPLWAELELSSVHDFPHFIVNPVCPLHVPLLSDLIDCSVSRTLHADPGNVNF